MKNASIAATALLATLALSVAGSPVVAQKLVYPASKKVDRVRTFFGVKVEDPYGPRPAQS